MGSDQIGSLIYLILLGLLVGSYVLVANRRNLGQMTRHAVLWGLIFLGIAVGAGLWQDIRQGSTLQQSVQAEGETITLNRLRDGHFHMALKINGAPVNFLVDTGATEMVLSLEDAAKVGIDTGKLAFLGRARTANGQIETARVWLDRVELAGQVETKVPAQVSRGDMPGSLLGMSYLSRFEQITINGDRMVLTR
ncbi:TIGR02281 family clan AA aspartic protease [Fluviibacterium sp. DFM31]|uniref:TIGR02281 family clan AA aspartic protease n=1 Tax=Meridianimarinicoccus marinus TaxID=3231483 RepID=A0ABV3L1E9_9RHOB